MADVPLIKVSRQSINEKLFNVTEAELRAKLTGEDLDKAIALLPTEDEAEWMNIYQRDIPDQARAKRRMAICLEVEVDELKDDFISFTYGGSKYSIAAPINSFNVSEALEKSRHAAFEQLCKQGCVKKNDVTVDARRDNLGVDELSLLLKVADKFFFQIYSG